MTGRPNIENGDVYHETWLANQLLICATQRHALGGTYSDKALSPQLKMMSSSAATGGSGREPVTLGPVASAASACWTLVFCFRYGSLRFCPKNKCSLFLKPHHLRHLLRRRRPPHPLREW